MHLKLVIQIMTMSFNPSFHECLDLWHIFAADIKNNFQDPFRLICVVIYNLYLCCNLCYLRLRSRHFLLIKNPQNRLHMVLN